MHVPPTGSRNMYTAPLSSTSRTDWLPTGRTRRRVVEPIPHATDRLDQACSTAEFRPEAGEVHVNRAREGQLSVDESVRIATEVGSALQVAHDAGIIHRDVKPENILLEGKERRALLMDFGIAKVAEGAGGGITGTGSLVGTPLYMSPEQASGDTRLDARSDLYSLGCVLYEMLAGEPPFSGSNAHAPVFSQYSTDQGRWGASTHLLGRSYE